MIIVRLLLASSLLTGAYPLASQARAEPSSPNPSGASSFPGARSTWNGFDRYDFVVDGKPAMIIAPREAAVGRPWVWYGAFFGAMPALDVALLGRGHHIVYLGIPDLFGSPAAVRHWDAFYRELTSAHGLSKRAVIVGVSRGGLYAYNWAAASPLAVACIVGDAPVCDLKSWPLGRGQGAGNAGEIPKLLNAYNAADEAELLEVALNPVDNLEPLADAGIPLLHVYGDADTGVPWEENTGAVATRYRKLGGSIKLIAKPGVGHVHGLDDATPILEFIDASYRRCAAYGADPIAINSKRELFVDRFLIDQLRGAHLHAHEPRDAGRAIDFDEQWEGPQAGYATVIKDGDRYLMFYRGISKLTRDGSKHERTCVAVSADGISWTKPTLGLYEFEGRHDNNIVLADAAPATHNLSPMLDSRPGVPTDAKFKALGGTLDRLFAFVSPDGFKWRKLREEAVLDKTNVPIPHIHLFDSQNVSFWSEAEQKYVCYFRVWDGVRRIARTTSKDFVHWTPAVMMEQLHDDGSGPRPAPIEHLYTNQTSPYFRAPHIYVAIAARFFEGRQVISEEQAKAIGIHADYYKDTSDSVLLTSRGGHVYDRTFLEGYLKPGIGMENWVSRTNYPGLNIVPTSPTEMSFYVNHDYAQSTAHLRRYVLRTDGLASVRAGAAGGEVLTKPIVFTGEELHINFATSAGGAVRFELQNAAGEPLPGFTLADCPEQIGNEIDRVVAWNSGSDVSALAGRPVRLRCVMNDADLYSIVFLPREFTTK